MVGRPSILLGISAVLAVGLALAGGCRGTPGPDGDTRREVRALIARAMGENQLAIDRGDDVEGRRLPAAEANLQRAEALAAADPTLLAEVGRGYFYVGRHDDAERLLEPLVASADLEPGSDGWIIAREMLGRILIARGDTAGAEPLVRGAAEGLDELNQRDPRAYYGCPYQALGLLYAETGRAEEAARQYRKAADHEAANPETQLEAVERSLVAGELGAAARYARRALATVRSPKAWLQAVLLLRLVEHHRARERGGGPPPPHDLARFEAAASRQIAKQLRGPFESSGWTAARAATARAQTIVLRLVTDFERGEFALVADVAGALVDLPRALYDVEDRQPFRILQGFVALVRRDLPGATRVFGAPGEGPATNPAEAVGRGHLAIIAHDHARAEALLAPVVHAGEARFRAAADRRGAAALDWLVYRMACLGLAWSAANRNLHEQALAAYERVLVVSPADTYALLGKGNSLSGLARLDEAEALFRRVLEAEPDNPYALAELGLVAYNRGDEAAAEAAFSRALQQGDDRYTCPHEGLGLVYLRQGRLPEARRAFEKAIAIQPDIEYKKYNGLAKIHLRDGRIEEARRLLRKSIANYPHDPEARELLSSLPAGPDEAPSPSPP